MNIFKTKRQKLQFYKLLHFFAYFFSVLIFSIGVFSFLPVPNSSLTDIFSNLLFALLVITLVQIFLTKRHKISFFHLMGFSQKNLPKHLRQGLLAFCYIITLNFLLFNIISLFTNEALEFAKGQKIDNYSLIFSAIAVAPWFEEILFRGYIQTFFMKLFSPTTAIFITSFLFMTFHMQYWENFYSLLAVFVLSVAIGIIRVKAKSVTPCIFAHFLNNLFAIIRF